MPRLFIPAASPIRSISAGIARLVWVLAVSGLAVGCSAETAVPVDLDNPPSVDAVDPTEIPAPNVTHSLNATPEMQRLAREQCLEDETLDEGYIRAVDPDSGEILSEFTVECAEARSDG